MYNFIYWMQPGKLCTQLPPPPPPHGTILELRKMHLCHAILYPTWWCVVTYLISSVRGIMMSWKCVLVSIHIFLSNMRSPVCRQNVVRKIAKMIFHCYTHQIISSDPMTISLWPLEWLMSRHSSSWPFSWLMSRGTWTDTLWRGLTLAIDLLSTS